MPTIDTFQTLILKGTILDESMPGHNRVGHLSVDWTQGGKVCKLTINTPDYSTNTQVILSKADILALAAAVIGDRIQII